MNYRKTGSRWRTTRCARLVAACAAALICTACTGDSGADTSTRDSGNAGSVRTGSTVGWNMYNGGYDGERFSVLDQITAANTGGLSPVCSVTLGEQGTFESGPIVVGDTLIVTTPHSTVAINASDCTVIWRNVDPATDDDVSSVNRGAAYLDGRIFRGMPDGRLVALDSRTGKVLWQNPAGEPSAGEFISSAPIAWKGMVFVGIAGGDWGIRGHVMAFKASTGQEVWRFYTIPTDSAPGADSWKIRATAGHGGGGQWTSYALDTASNELFIPVGNPAPAFAPQTRPGDNLYTNSVVALNAATGRPGWYYQLTPNDGLGHDLGAAPMLYTTGKSSRIALGSKDGNVYVLDRTTHTVLFKTPVTTIAHADAVPTANGAQSCPGPLGGIDWNGPAYDPATKMIYAGAVDWCGRYVTTTAHSVFRRGYKYMDASHTPVTGDATGWITAMDAQTGQVRWKFHAPQPVVAGVTPTAGGVVFGGDIGGNFYALDASNGRVLFTRKLPGSLAGGIVTYAVAGKQYVALTSGSIGSTAFHTSGSPTLVVMALQVIGGSRDTTLSPIFPDTAAGTRPHAGSASR